MDDLDQSLDGESEWVYFKKQPTMEESLVATSEKVYFNNATSLNKADLERSKNDLPKVSEEPLE
jgi:hypothetical protein